MAITTGIAWTDHTFNPWWGCVKVSPGCDRCYADTFSHRLALNIWGKDSERRFFGDQHWEAPLRWNRKAERDGVRRRIFCASMCDIMEGREDQRKSLQRLWKLIESTPQLDWQLLTKRPQNYRRLLPKEWLEAPRPNVWLGTTVEAENYTWRIDELVQVPAVVRFISWEPALGPVEFRPWAGELSWIIAGGESGPGCRPMDLAWARDVRDQCQEMGAAFFMKQLGGCPNKRDNPDGWPEDLRIREFPRSPAGGSTPAPEPIPEVSVL